MSDRKPYILTINTGSTSTKLGLFEGDKLLEQKELTHSSDKPAVSFDEALKIRLKQVKAFVKDKRVDLIMARGGILQPMESGVYEVNERMLEALRNAPVFHESNLSVPIAFAIAKEKSIKAYIADPVTVDELQAVARYAGHPLFERKSIFHALNQKAVARKFAMESGKKYEDLHLIVAHLGGGISIGAHRRGWVVDVNQALDGEGPFSPERSGTLPSGDLVRAAFSGKYSEKKLLKMIKGEGGLKAYTGTSDMRKLDLHNPDTKEVVDAMIYQIAKYIGEMAVVLRGKIDAVILTGGLAHSSYITKGITDYVSFLAPVKVYPGENELAALAFNGLLVWEGKLKVKRL